MIRETFFLPIFAYFFFVLFFTISPGHWTCFRLWKRQTVMASHLHTRARAAVRLARSLCYEVSVTRFAHIQFGPQQLSLSLYLSRLRIRNFSSSSLFSSPYFFHIIFAVSFRAVWIEKARENRQRGPLNSDSSRLMQWYILYLNETDKSERKRKRRRRKKKKKVGFLPSSSSSSSFCLRLV